MWLLPEEIHLNFSANIDTWNQMLGYRFEKLLPWNWEWNGMGVGRWRKKYFQFPSWLLGNRNLNPPVAVAQFQLGLISLWPPPWILLPLCAGEDKQERPSGGGTFSSGLNPKFLPVSPGWKMSGGPAHSKAFLASPLTEQTNGGSRFPAASELFLDSSTACASVKRVS